MLSPILFSRDTVIKSFHVSDHSAGFENALSIQRYGKLKVLVKASYLLELTIIFSPTCSVWCKSNQNHTSCHRLTASSANPNGSSKIISKFESYTLAHSFKKTNTIFFNMSLSFLTFISYRKYREKQYSVLAYTAIFAA